MNVKQQCADLDSKVQLYRIYLSQMILQVARVFQFKLELEAASVSWQLFRNETMGTNGTLTQAPRSSRQEWVLRPDVFPRDSPISAPFTNTKSKSDVLGTYPPRCSREFAKAPCSQGVYVPTYAPSARRSPGSATSQTPRN